MTESELLCNIKTTYRQILGDNLTGIYIHGSLAFGCFHWDTSDIDFIVVVKEDLALSAKTALITALLSLDAYAPPKGFEMSVVLESACNPFVYPTPFVLHYSNIHKAGFQKDLNKYCQAMQGTDLDLAAHFTVLRQTGMVLCGNAIPDVFADVPKTCFLNSIRADMEEAAARIAQNPIYFILNACRTCAYLKEGILLSKEQGGMWGMRHLPAAFSSLIQQALHCYSAGRHFQASQETLHHFTAHVLTQLHKKTG